MNNDNQASSLQEKRLKKKTTCLHQCTELPVCVESSHLKSEQNETLALSASSLKHKSKAKGKKSLKHSLRTAVDLHSPLCNLDGDKNMVSPLQQKLFPRRSHRLSLILNNDLAKFSSRKNAADYGFKSLNLGLNDNKFAKVISPEEISNLFCSVSLNAKHSISADSSLVDSKERVNDSTTDIAFSPVCSGRDSNTDDLKNDVAKIIETLAEGKNGNEKLSQRQSNSSSDNEESNFMKNILKGVIAYVEVRSGHENRTKAIERQLHEVGAKTVPKFFSRTTHVIFKEGRKSTRDKAVARNIPLVSVLWVESCKQQKQRVPEADFPANVPEIYDSPLLCRRIRKLKSMQPKDFNVEFAGSIERLNKIFSRIRQDNEYYSPSDSFCGSETSASIKDDDPVSDDDHTPLSCKMPVARYMLFDSSSSESKITQLKDKIRSDEIATSSKHQEKNSDPSAFATEATDFTIKRRKLLSDLNQSSQLTITSPNCVKKKVKCSSTPRRKMTRSKAGFGMSVKQLTNVKNKNAQTENNQCTNASLSVMTDKNCQHKDKKDLMDSDLPLANLKENTRNSLDDFEDKKHKKEKCYKTKCISGNSFDSDGVNNTRLSSTAVKKPTIVLTSFQSIDREVICSIIESLGGFLIKRTVTKITTHVISGDHRRTLNVLFGLVRGCWILSSQWVYQSMEAGHWLEEKPFQLSKYFPALQVSHLECANYRPGYCHNLFGQLGNIFVSSQCIPSCDNLIELIRLAGGKVSSCLRKCIVLIGPHVQSRRESKANPSVAHVSEKWILDCISQYKILPFDDYKI